MEQQPNEEATTDQTNPETPAWAQGGQNSAEQQGGGSRGSWERTPPPPSGAELEPGEQPRSTVEQEQRSGETTGYNEQGISATDAEMGAESGTAGQRPGWTPRSGERRGQGAGAQSGQGDFQQRWQAIQAQFVDDPKAAVQQADQFFEQLIERLNQERQQLREQLGRGDQSSTEDMRVALQRYRDYFQRHFES